MHGQVMRVAHILVQPGNGEGVVELPTDEGRGVVNHQTSYGKVLNELLFGLAGITLAPCKETRKKRSGSEQK